MNAIQTTRSDLRGRLVSNSELKKVIGGEKEGNGIYVMKCPSCGFSYVDTTGQGTRRSCPCCGTAMVKTPIGI